MGWRGWRDWEGMNMRARIARRSNFRACRPNSRFRRLGRSSSSPPISFIPSTDFVLRCWLGGHSEAGVRHAQREENLASPDRRDARRDPTSAARDPPLSAAADAHEGRSELDANEAAGSSSWRTRMTLTLKRLPLGG